MFLGKTNIYDTFSWRMFKFMIHNNFGGMIMTVQGHWLITTKANLVSRVIGSLLLTA